MYLVCIHVYIMLTTHCGRIPVLVCPDIIRTRVLLPAVAALDLSVLRRLYESAITAIADGTFAGLSEMTFL